MIEINLSDILFDIPQGELSTLVRDMTTADIIAMFNDIDDFLA